LGKKEDILALCIEDIRSGRSSLAECLERYPSMRQHLEPLLRIALSIQEPPDIKPSNAFRVRARVHLVEQIHATRNVKQTWYPGWLKIAALVVAIVLAASALGTGTAYAAQDSLPGDTLYHVKLGVEQVRRVLNTGDTARVKLELAFAGVRLEEMEALANEAPDRIGTVTSRYERNIAMAIERTEYVGNGGASASVSEEAALTMSRHLCVLDGIEDNVPETAREAIRHAKEIAIGGQIEALRILTRENPLRAAEINLDTLQNRLYRAKVNAERNEAAEVEIALRQFEELRRFGEEISQTAKGLGYNTAAVDELNAHATSAQLEVLGDIYGKVSEETKGAVEKALEVSVEGHGQAVEGLRERGALGDIPEEPALPEEVPEKVKERILKPEPKGSGPGRH